MNKPLKIISIVLASIFLILGLGVAYLSLVFDPNQFKAQLIELVKNKKHRDLHIDGNIQLNFFPKLGVSLEKITLSEFESSTQFAALERAKVSLALLPLLQKQIVIDKVTLHGLQLRYQVDAEGKSNIDDLSQSTTSTPQNDSKVSAEKSMQFAIDGIEISQSELEIDDQKANLKGKIKNLNLNTGKIIEQSKTPIKLSANLAFDKPKAEIKVDIQTQLLFDSAQKNLELFDLKALIGGQLGDSPLEVQLETAALKHSPAQTQSEQIKLSAKMGGTQELKADISVHQLAMREKVLRIGELDVKASAQQHGASKQIDLKTSLTMGLDTQIIELPQIAMKIKLQDPKSTQTEIVVPVTGKLTANLKDKQIDAKLDAKFDETQLHTTIQVHDFSSPAINFNVDMDQLNVDRYVKKTAETNKGETNQEEDLNLSGLKSLKLNGLVRIGALQVKNLHIKQLELPLKSTQGQFTMNGISAKLYQGSVTGDMQFDVDGNRFRLQQNLSNIQINPLLLDFLKKDMVEGRGSVSLNINTHGKRVSQFKDNLNGTVRTQLVDGAVKGINLAKSLRDFKAKILNKTNQQQAANQLEKTDFSAMSASIVFTDGIGNSDDLDMKSPFLRVGGKGQVNLRNSSLDYTARATIVNTSTGQDGADLAQLKDLTIPVRISGPFDQLGYQLQFAQISSEALKSAFKAKAAPVIEEKKKELKEKVNEQLKDKLKGLFGQ